MGSFKRLHEEDLDNILYCECGNLADDKCINCFQPICKSCIYGWEGNTGFCEDCYNDYEEE